MYSHEERSLLGRLENDFADHSLGFARHFRRGKPTMGREPNTFLRDPSVHAMLHRHILNEMSGARRSEGRTARLRTGRAPKSRSTERHRVRWISSCHTAALQEDNNPEYAEKPTYRRKLTCPSLQSASENAPHSRRSAGLLPRRR